MVSCLLSDQRDLPFPIWPIPRMFPRIFPDRNRRAPAGSVHVARILDSSNFPTRWSSCNLPRQFSIIRRRKKYSLQRNGSKRRRNGKFGHEISFPGIIFSSFLISVLHLMTIVHLCEKCEVLGDASHKPKSSREKIQTRIARPEWYENPQPEISCLGSKCDRQR